jgi:hypothetical protein
MSLNLRTCLEIKELSEKGLQVKLELIKHSKEILNWKMES